MQTGPALKLHVGFQGIVYCHPGESPYRLIQHVGHILVVLGSADLVQDAVDAVLIHRDALGQQTETGRFVELLLYGRSGVSTSAWSSSSRGGGRVGDVPVHPSIRKRVGAEMETERLGQSAADKVSVVQSRRVSGCRRSSVPQQAEKVGPDAPQQRGGNILLVHLLILGLHAGQVAQVLFSEIAGDDSVDLAHASPIPERVAASGSKTGSQTGRVR